MVTQEFKHLFSPLKIGPMTVPNRIVCPAHWTCFFHQDELPNERLMHYLATKARGGVGMIVTPQNTIWPSSTAHGYVATHDDKAIPAFRMISQAIQEHGAKVVAQLVHFGTLSGFVETGGAGLAPSAIGGSIGLLPHPLAAGVPHEMDIDDIKQMVASYADTAYRMREAGYNGVEICCDVATGQLLLTFISALTNRRTDEYGGSPENRCQGSRRF